MSLQSVPISDSQLQALQASFHPQAQRSDAKHNQIHKPHCRKFASRYVRAKSRQVHAVAQVDLELALALRQRFPGVPALTGALEDLVKQHAAEPGVQVRSQKWSPPVSTPV